MPTFCDSSDHAHEGSGILAPLFEHNSFPGVDWKLPANMPSLNTPFKRRAILNSQKQECRFLNRYPVTGAPTRCVREYLLSLYYFTDLVRIGKRHFGAGFQRSYHRKIRPD